MCVPVLLHKSARVCLEKAQILLKRKRFFPIPLPKSSFEGMRRFFVCNSFPISNIKIPVYLHNSIFPALGKEEIFLKGQNFSRHPPRFFPYRNEGYFSDSQNAEWIIRFLHKNFRPNLSRLLNFSKSRKNFFWTPQKLPYRNERSFSARWSDV